MINYLQHFGLKDEPFRLTPDPQFLHLSESHREALVGILGIALLKKGFGVVTGPIGTGKTTLIHSSLQLIHQRYGAKIPTALLVNPTLTRDELLEAVLDELEIPCPSPSKPRRLAALYSHCLKTQAAGGTTVLIVDEAHLLTVDLLEDLRLLSNADTHREKLLQIVLSGQPELLRLLAEPELGALAQRIAAFFTLRQLSLEECRTYITQRLRSAGYSGVFPLIAPEAVEQVHRLSKGVPRLVNLLCDRSLSMAANLRMKYVTPEVVLDGALKLSVLALQPKASAPPTPITGNGKPVMPAVQSKAGVAGAMHE